MRFHGSRHTYTSPLIAYGVHPKCIQPSAMPRFLFAMSQDFVYPHWKRLGGYKDIDHHIKFRVSDIRRRLQRKAKDGPPCG